MSQPASNIRIDSDRLWDSLMEMAKIGPGVAGGNNRQTLTDEDSQGRELFKQWCLKEGCTMGLDQMGNMFARREGTDPNALPVMVGNIATSEAAKDLIKAGADALKVGIGPGSICTTRIVAGVGVPQLHAISETYKFAKKNNVPLVSDGGIKFSGDIAKALAAGADAVMIGSLFAGTDEAPGKLIKKNGILYKNFRGMGSVGAMNKGSADRYFQKKQKDTSKYVPEGVEGFVKYKGEVGKVIYKLIGGLKSSMGYLGSNNIKKLRNKPQFVKITKAGFYESMVHNVDVVKNESKY